MKPPTVEKAWERADTSLGFKGGVKIGQQSYCLSSLIHDGHFVGLEQLSDLKCRGRHD